MDVHPVFFILPATIAAAAVIVRISIWSYDNKRLQERNSSTLFRAFKKDIDKMPISSSLDGQQPILDAIQHIVEENIFSDPTFDDLNQQHKTLLKTRCEKYLTCKNLVETVPQLW